MIAAKVASSGALDKIAAEWRMPKELASDLVSIALSRRDTCAKMNRSSYPSSMSSFTSTTRDPWPSKSEESESTI
jgi:hypothetical protein